ncbi:MAG: fused MFS/spermidine synthase [Lachnospiraceae bacterium]|nr:fused MFS/spermidine synthase [Lachnospiraceae bacterium]
MDSQRDILKNKTYLYLTEFFSGMAVMAVELGASRLLAPYFSSSQIVWTIIIATIMIAMALGNIYGGKSADRDPNPDRLYRRLLIAAVWIAAIPLLGKYIIIGITGLLVIAVNQNFLIIAAFFACMIIFVFPCFLLGTCTPSLARYTVSSLDDSGRTVGTLGAFNTIGSIIGTFLPTFVTIPAVGTAVTFLIFSGVLLVLSLIYFVSRKTGKRAVAVSVVLFLICSVFGHGSEFAFWENDLTYEGESIYNYLQVRETPDSVILSTNVLFGVQSVLMKSDSLTGMYYDYAMAAPVMAGITGARESGVQTSAAQEAPDAGSGRPRMLILGMGTGTFARQCSRYFGEMEVCGVEIDEKITELARTYFDEPESAVVTTYDGRAYLDADKTKYDVIMVDAYQDITIPFQMSSAEFFSSVRDHLTENGVMVVNMNMRSSSPDGINVYLADTIAGIFPFVQTVDVAGSTNRELFAAMHEITGGEFAASASQIGDPDLRAMMERVGEDLTDYASTGHLLTDDKAPVELLGMQAIDEIIRDELGYYKEVYRRDGIQGILGMV